ncbi:MerR family transcriptional regulator [Devosia sp. XJ19-1]|uniref:MerR family transcriptional regulator n=1 Tax=Devosia ureilytica TaxID=2952754 RepID=A0A9Q4FSM3_9HYPH|nr:MerR family transcriptional regulator [Devosia ureilytica]MCP8883412.1 MerR family transcriptional regulator [Devosia ureilytica]MCP8887020.1 MerR family transcriptional regulator [Devosia ureilytica]
MKTYTVTQLARLAGVSVRTLHHYDDVGLLKPAFTGDNRYRYYGEEELLRLQQILIHRELDISLAEIGAILDAPGFDRLDTLRQQRDRLEEQAKRYAGMVRTIDRTIARLNGECKMDDKDLYSGVVSAEKQAVYEAWLVDRYGPDMETDIEASRKAATAMSDAERAAWMAELKTIEEGLAEGLRQGLPPQAAALDPMIERHRSWVARSWGRECSPEAYAGLADIYEHPDFRKRYEAIAPGFAGYLVSAMKAWARRQTQ